MNLPAISKFPVLPYASMSHTSALSPPRSGAMRLNLLVRESITARLPTLPRTAPACVLTWEIRPPNQMLVPTCSMALTRPSIMGVLSGTFDGNASTAPLARRKATAVESDSKTVLLIPISPFSGTEDKKTKPRIPSNQRRG